MAINPVLEHPAPDFDELALVVKGEKEPNRVHLIEVDFDPEVVQVITERYLDENYIPLTSESQELHYAQLVRFYYRLGYDCVPLGFWPFDFINHPAVEFVSTEDTAELSRGEREFFNEHRGLIASWEDLERFPPMDEIKPDYSRFEFASQHLPEGMKIAVSSCLFGHVVQALLGYEGFFYLLYDDSKLVAELFTQWGQKVYDFYESVIGFDEVGVIWHCDDMGFRTSTMISPNHLRQYLFPWLKEYAALAHEHGKMLWLHACGNLYANGVIEDLIDDVQIDALHSFQDIVLPITDFKTRFGGRVAALGGIDMDKLCRLDKGSLRAYIRGILERCMPSGRFALGSGNTIANYVPLSNYFVMLDEGRRWYLFAAD